MYLWWGSALFSSIWFIGQECDAITKFLGKKIISLMQIFKLFYMSTLLILSNYNVDFKGNKLVSIAYMV